ncbi:hypothetical protein VULLAG_LOCUS16244 [Vulpes lagopus]
MNVKLEGYGSKGTHSSIWCHLLKLPQGQEKTQSCAFPLCSPVLIALYLEGVWNQGNRAERSLGLLHQE